MAIISIPTSVGGINIPGSVISGPLSSLYKNQYDKQLLQYPRDLNSATRGHVVEFTVSKIKPVTIEETKTLVSKFGNGAMEVGQQFKQDPQKAAQDAVSGIKSAFNNGVQSVSTALSSNIEVGYGTQRTETIGYINLYMPENVTFSYNAQYDKTSVAEAAGSLPLVGSIAKGITSALENSAAKLALQRMGYVFNPQQQMLFEGIDFRTYQMSFTFTPYSRAEADQVNRIIKMFRMYAAPIIRSDLAGMFFVPPGVFDIRFLFNGAPNRNLNRVTRSVLESVEVNYAPNGWSAHSDGSPVQTTMTLSFKETVLVDRNMIEQGF
jgi:hypothetical protein